MNEVDNILKLLTPDLKMLAKEFAIPYTKRALADESMQDYFERILNPLGGIKKSLIFIPCGGSEKGWQNPDKAVSLWRSLQT